MMGEILYQNFPTEALLPAEEEIAARLRTPIGYRDDAIEKAERELKETIQAGMVAVRVPIEIQGDVLLFPDFSAESAALAKNLAGCREAYLMAVTLGIKTERWLHRLSILSPAKHFLADGLASAYAEAAADLANAMLGEKKHLASRFSPGYADLPLSIQSDLLNATEANKHLHITLSDSLLMIPQKSITAIIGIRSEDGKGE